MTKEKATAVFRVTDGVTARPWNPPAAVPRGKQPLIADTWVPSRFNVGVDLPDGRRAVFNSATGSTIVLDQQAWRRWLGQRARHSVGGGSTAEALRLLHGKGFLVSAGVDELELVRLHYLALRYQQDLVSVNVVPTLACNLRCSYCFEGKVQAAGGGKKMSRETEEAVVRYILKLAQGKTSAHIVWFGGEPLLAVGSIERISARVLPAFKKARVKHTQTIVTNGTLLGPAVIERLAKCKISYAQVTVDIPKETKRDQRGRDTLDKVLDNIASAARKITVYLRINLIRDDEAEFDELYRGLLRRGLEKKLKTIMLAHVLEPECGRGGCRFQRAAPEVFVEVVRRERAKARDLGLPVESLPSSSGGACAATCRGSAAIDPDGLVYKCVEDLGLSDRAYASVFDEQRVKLGNLVPWMTYDWFQDPACRQCNVLPQCAGGCPHKRLFQADTWKGNDFCYWHVRGDLEGRISEQATRGKCLTL